MENKPKGWAGTKRTWPEEAVLRSCLPNSLVMTLSLVLPPQRLWNMVSILWTTENNFCIVYASNNSIFKLWWNHDWRRLNHAAGMYAVGILLCLNFRGKGGEIASHKDNSQWQTPIKIGMGFGYSVARVKTKKQTNAPCHCHCLKLERKEDTVHLLHDDVRMRGRGKYQRRERQMFPGVGMKPPEMAWLCWIYCGFWI